MAAEKDLIRLAVRLAGLLEKAYGRLDNFSGDPEPSAAQGPCICERCGLWWWPQPTWRPSRRAIAWKEGTNEAGKVILAALRGSAPSDSTEQPQDLPPVPGPSPGLEVPVAAPDEKRKARDERPLAAARPARGAEEWHLCSHGSKKKLARGAPAWRPEQAGPRWREAQRLQEKRATQYKALQGLGQRMETMYLRRGFAALAQTHPVPSAASTAGEAEASTPAAGSQHSSKGEKRESAKQRKRERKAQQAGDAAAESALLEQAIAESRQEAEEQQEKLEELAQSPRRIDAGAPAKPAGNAHSGEVLPSCSAAYGAPQWATALMSRAEGLCGDTLVAFLVAELADQVTDDRVFNDLTDWLAELQSRGRISRALEEQLESTIQ